MSKLVPARIYFIIGDHLEQEYSGLCRYLECVENSPGKALSFGIPSSPKSRSTLSQFARYQVAQRRFDHRMFHYADGPQAEVAIRFGIDIADIVLKQPEENARFQVA